MRLRIETCQEDGTTAVHVDGELIGEGAGELEKLVRSITGKTVLDLSHLTIADSEGLQTIHRLEEEGSEVRGASAFIQLQLAKVRPHPGKDVPV